jgi:rSAM/selenodomain-associated transferase 2
MAVRRGRVAPVVVRLPEARSLSVIVPTLNEGDWITATLTALQPLRLRGAEVIVVDGGSTDATVTRAMPLADRVVVASRGRAEQQNAGARLATGDVLIFLHADTLLPAGADRLIEQALAGEGRVWGRFDVEFDASPGLLAVVAWMMNLRSRASGIATGDQVIFVRRDAFKQTGGFPQLPIMEDIALSKRLKRVAQPAALRTKVVTSARRWRANGVCRTVVLMWCLRLAYFVGVAPGRLARLYR